MNENTYSIVLIDHESNDLYIAEVITNWDLKRIVEENEKLNEEQRNDDRERDDYYEELWIRTWLNIYKADFLYI